MLTFSDRLIIEKEFYHWARTQTPMVKECPNSLIAFLEGNGLLNEEKTKEFITNSMAKGRILNERIESRNKI